jgi:hypothetical protein
LTVTDGNQSSSSVLQLSVSADPTIPVIVSSNSASLTAGHAFYYAIAAPSAADPSDPNVFNLVGALPAGLSFNPATGIISGTYTGSLQDGVSVGNFLAKVQLFATNSFGSTTSQLLFVAAPSGVLNISTRLQVGRDDNVLIGGLIITGDAPKKVIIRAVGPSLIPVGISGAMHDPTLELHDSAHPAIVILNDNWKDSQEQLIRNTGLPPSDELESAIVATLAPGAYTAIVRGKSNTTGVALVEVYDLGTESLDASGNARLAEIATRGTVSTGDNVMIGGFINSSAVSRVIVRAIGPSLNGILPGALQDPVLELHNESGSLIASNDDWRSRQEQEIIDTGLAPTNDRESAVVATLNPGAYTGIVRGANDATGVALVEVYRLQ